MTWSPSHDRRGKDVVEYDIYEAYKALGNASMVANVLVTKLKRVTDALSHMDPDEKKLTTKYAWLKDTSAAADRKIDLKEAADSFGSNTLTVKQYEQWRRRTGRGVNHQAVIKTFNSWTLACENAGLQRSRVVNPEKGIPGRRQKFSNQECIRALAEAKLYIGHWPSIREYDELKVTKPSMANAPSSATIRSHFQNSWIEALRAAAGL